MEQKNSRIMAKESSAVNGSVQFGERGPAVGGGTKFTSVLSGCVRNMLDTVSEKRE